MNLAFFLRPKSMVTYLYDDISLQRGLCKLRESGYPALPVLSREGKYLGVISEGDFLWYLAESHSRQTALRDTKLRDILALHPPHVRAMPITTTMEELLHCASRQNFLPVVDDSGSFIGIVSRGDIIRYFADGLASPPRERITVAMPAAASAT